MGTNYCGNVRKGCAVFLAVVLILSTLFSLAPPDTPWVATAGAQSPTMTATPDAVTEKAGFNQTFSLTLSDDQFLNPVSAVYVALGGDFSSLSVGEVV